MEDYEIVYPTLRAKFGVLQSIFAAQAVLSLLVNIRGSAKVFPAFVVSNAVSCQISDMP